MSGAGCDGLRLETVEDVAAERDALTRRVARLEAALIECEKERADMKDQLAWMQTVADGQSALWEMRVSEFRGLVRTVLQSVQSTS